MTFIQTVCKPEAVYLLGVEGHSTSYESIFNGSDLHFETNNIFFILILVRDCDRKRICQIQDKLENNSSSIDRILSIVVDCVEFERWIKSGQPFATRVISKALLLLPLDKKAEDVVHVEIGDEESPRNSPIQLGMIRSREFMAAAESFLIRKMYSLSLFMLHQAAEQMLSWSIEVHIGYRPSTHNLHRLMKYATWALPDLQHIYNFRLVNDQRIFSLLQKSYSEARYCHSFKIDGTDAGALIIMVKRMSSAIESTLLAIPKNLRNETVN